MGHNGVWVGLKNSWNTVKLVVMWLQVGTIDSNPVISSIMYFGALFFFSVYLSVALSAVNFQLFLLPWELIFHTYAEYWYLSKGKSSEEMVRKWISFDLLSLYDAFLYILNWMQLMKNTVKSQHSHITRWEQRMFRDFVWRITQTLNQPSKYFIISALDRCTVTNVIYLPWSSDFITQTADVAFLVFRSVI